MCIQCNALKTFHFLPRFLRNPYEDKTGQCIPQHETEVIITYLGSYPEVEFPPSSFRTYVFRPQLAKDENLAIKCQTKLNLDRKGYGEKYVSYVTGPKLLITTQFEILELF